MSDRGLSTVRDGSLLSEEFMNAFCKLIATGNYPRTACKLMGVIYQNYVLWMTLGAKSDDGPYHDFYVRVQQAEAAAEAYAVKTWNDQLTKSYQAPRDFLARRYPQRWGEKIEVNLVAKAQIEEMVTRLQLSLSDEVFAQVMAALASDELFLAYAEMAKNEEEEESEYGGGS